MNGNTARTSKGKKGGPFAVTKNFGLPARSGKLLLILTSCIVIFALLFGAGCIESLQDSETVETGLDHGNGKEEDNMEKAYINESKPLLDQGVPSELETATLGMG